ncbi:formimidoylglutamate deiminase [Roseobacter sinensis]|uniref:Formimidoylglutamate deiminase n=1 Tax=Roseobacter sinensis TaxID=2931391 RepID=A0ABT3BB24_9RHOB|nr:formimidoylglutamate deiminase [Roseobacter sp. WL0113]MCV3270777.1 formimidoylglutamate deiminase [Roseobacter sp. WL0113]
MQHIWAEQALLPTGWARDVHIAIGADGRIAKVEEGALPQGLRRGILLPAPVNAHSHAFQRAMAGLTEARGSSDHDSFWSWRQLMFRFLNQLTPEHVEAITAFVQMEMLEAGYAAHAEFHYLHHQPGGAPYDTLAEMCDRIVAASARSGIGLCLLPVHYEFGGCDGRALSEGQLRFGNDLDRFTRLYDAAAASLRARPADSTLGVAPHSLRAVGPGDLKRYAEHFPSGPIHMHLAEQIAEVAEVEAQWGARPAQWVLDNIPVDARWCLIHCTQMTTQETAALARSGAVAGLCPITESSLGDGIFDAVGWLAAGGRMAIGSDSNIRIALSEEIRTLEYSQRLRDHSRAALATRTRSTGRRIFDVVVQGGAQAIGRDSGALSAGRVADICALDGRAVHLAGRTGDALLDTWLFAADDRLVTDVWSAGRHLVQEGRHHDREGIVAAYRRTICDLRDRL